MRIVVSDVDDVLADLVTEWLNQYNSDFNDKVKKSDVIDWDVSQFIKNKKYKKYLYEYIENPNLYDKIQPIRDSLWGINQIRNLGYRVVFVTSSTHGQSGRKWQWLKDNHYIYNREDYIEALDKSLIKGDYMIDDKFHNVFNFSDKGILYNQPWNIKENWNLRANNWKNVVEIIKRGDNIL